MARRVKDPLRPHETVDEDKGRVYFSEPELILVEHPIPKSILSAPVPMQQQRDPNPVLDIAGALEGPIRTHSCNYTGAMNRPKGIPDTVRYACSQKPTVADINEYLLRNDIHGYGTGAIVARRWAYPWRFLYHHQWGVIKVQHWAPTKENWFPYTVKWMEVGQEELAWAEDLIIIHASLSEDLLCSIAEDQGIDTTEAREFVERSRRRDAT